MFQVLSSSDDTHDRKSSSLPFMSIAFPKLSCGAMRSCSLVHQQVDMDKRYFFSFCFALAGVCPTTGVRVLVDAREKLHIPWGDPDNQVHGETMMGFDTRSTMMIQGMVETKVFNHYLPSIRALWNDSGIQNAYDRRREFQLVRTDGYALYCSVYILLEFTNFLRGALRKAFICSSYTNIILLKRNHLMYDMLHKCG